MGRVLVVEDNELNLKLFHDLLTIQEHEVIISRDGLNLVELIQSTRPDLILMDIHLNGLSGIDLIQTLKANQDTKHIPIITITAFALKVYQIRISKSGCDMYLSKPVSIDKFFKAIEKFIPSVTKKNISVLSYNKHLSSIEVNLKSCRSKGFRSLMEGWSIL